MSMRKSLYLCIYVAIRRPRVRHACACAMRTINHYDRDKAIMGATVSKSMHSLSLHYMHCLLFSEAKARPLDVLHHPSDILCTVRAKYLTVTSNNAHQNVRCSFPLSSKADVHYYMNKLLHYMQYALNRLLNALDITENESM